MSDGNKSDATGDERPIVLVGMRASGKTTVGRELARRLHRRFVDLDEETVTWARHSGVDAPDVGALLERVGELRFRELEAHVLRRALEGGTRVVLAGGGGIVERADNRAWLRRAGRSVLLRVPPEVLRERLAADPGQRPPLAGDDAVSEVEALWRRRQPLYLEVADHVVDVGAEADASEVVQRVLDALAGAPAGA